jgi:hypothetical protein
VRNATQPPARLGLHCAMAVLAEQPVGRPEPARRLTPAHEEYAIQTWRYLRLAMIGLVAGLLVAVVYEWRQVPGHCFQTSISAYWYTPVRGYFVAALLAMGTCLFCLKGSTPHEDVLLSLAGMFAAVVALVPTPDPGGCTSLRGSTVERPQDIANNATALMAIGLFAVVVLAILWFRSGSWRPPRPEFVVLAVLWALAALLFEASRDAFMGSAHDLAAYAMFGCILGVVGLNMYETRGRTRVGYALVALAMVASAVVMGVLALRGWGHWVIGVETAFIVLFAGFWVIQTIELWHPGLRRSA